MYKHVVNLLQQVGGYLLGGIQQQNYNNVRKMSKHVGGLPHVCISLSVTMVQVYEITNRCSYTQSILFHC